STTTAIPAATTSGDQGVEGTVTMGSSCPNEPPGGCAGGAPATITVRNSQTNVATSTARSGSDGRFRISLAPGSYLLDTRTDSGQACHPTPVTVAAGRYTAVTVSCSKGIY